jgi:hypothetical protein
MLPVGPQRWVPGVHPVVHALHAPPVQNSLVAQGVEVLQVVQPLLSFAHVSIPLPSHWVVPSMQGVPHMPHVPPLQKSVHVCPDCHDVQPLESVTQV